MPHHEADSSTKQGQWEVFKVLSRGNEREVAITFLKALVMEESVFFFMGAVAKDTVPSTEEGWLFYWKRVQKETDTQSLCPALFQ